MSLLSLSALGALALSGPTTTQADASTLAQFDLASGEVQTLALPDAVSGRFAIDLVLDGQVERVELFSHSVRGENFQVLVQGADGAYVPTEVSAPTTVRGSVAGRSGAWVAGSLKDGQLEALIDLGDGRSFGVQPTESALLAAGQQAHVIYEASDIEPPPGLCGTPDGPLEFAPAQGAGSAALGSGVANFRVCEIACDADVEFYNQNQQSVDNTVADIENILIATEAIYGFEAEVLYEIGTIIVRTAEPDPYSSTAPSTLLQQFDSHWSSQQQGVQRDIAHLFTGKNLDGSVIGIARLNAICSQTNGYGLSQSKYTGSFVLRVRLTAHELGHNWSANHCNGQNDCGIMCQGGCGSPTQFGNQSTNSILNEKASSGCLSLLTETPELLSVSGDATVWLPEPVELQGTGLFTATDVTVDGNPADFTVIDDLTIEIVPPLPNSLGDVPVMVTTPLGTTGSVTMTYVDTDPPQLVAPNNPPSGGDAFFSFAGKANAAALIIFSLDNTTVPIEGLDILVPEVIEVLPNLSNLGLGNLTVELPPLPIFTLIFSQVVTVDLSGASATEVEASIVFI